MVVLGDFSRRGDRVGGLGRGFLGRHVANRSLTKVLESGLVCLKCGVDGLEVTMVGRYIVGEYAGGKKGAYGALEREISKLIFHAAIFGSPYFGYFFNLYMFYNPYSGPCF